MVNFTWAGSCTCLGLRQPQIGVTPLFAPGQQTAALPIARQQAVVVLHTVQRQPGVSQNLLCQFALFEIEIGNADAADLPLFGKGDDLF